MTNGLPQAVLLDLDDTIVSYSEGTERCWEDACVCCAAELGDVDPRALLHAIERTREWYWADPERHRRGRLDLDGAAREVVARSLDALGASVGTRLEASRAIAARYRSQREAEMQLFPDAVETVRWLRDGGCRLALVTNGASAAQRARIDRFGLAPMFDAILIEEEVGCGKPDPRIYTQALDVLGVAAADSWMVGDHLEFDVAQPQRMGLRGIWVDARGAGLPEANGVQPYRIVRALSELRGASI
ncbi:MAG: HAD family hydrolase [Acidobacteria bacterium]|nr:HAD family hydrolase [Acidobacteriota bacterium]